MNNNLMITLSRQINNKLRYINTMVKKIVTTISISPINYPFFQNKRKSTVIFPS